MSLRSVFPLSVILVLLLGMVAEARPFISTVSPRQGTQAGGTTVTITGSGFVASGTTVTFGGVLARNVIVAADRRSLRCTTPAGLNRGTVNVTVRDATGSWTFYSGFTYLDPAPTL